MALTGLQIFKLLPGGKKEPEANCKKCGFPTCMAFAMKLAKKETSINLCPNATDELKTELEEALQIQQAEVCFGIGENKVKVGGETVMFRHDKTFVNSTCICIKLNSNNDDFDKKLDEIVSYSTERVGEIFKINAIALEDNNNKENFLTSAVKITEKNIPIILISENIENIEAVLSKIKDFKPLVFLKSNDINKIAHLESTYKVPVIIQGNSLDELAENSEKFPNKNENIVLKLNQNNTDKIISNLTYIRRAAIEDKFKPFGLPVITFIDEIKGTNNNIIKKTIWSSTVLAKYSNIIVLDSFDKTMIYALSTLKQNLYTDPQKPLQVESKLYEIGDVTENSPIFVTTNFALTYFSVVSEIESANIPSYLLITPSDGMSVLTAWAASKFTGEIIAKAVKNANLEALTNHKKLIIPGYLDSLKPEIEEELPDWEIIIGPNEASELVDFFKTLN